MLKKRERYSARGTKGLIKTQDQSVSLFDHLHCVQQTKFMSGGGMR